MRILRSLGIAAMLLLLAGCGGTIHLKEVGRSGREDSFVKAAKNFDGLSDLSLSYLNANLLTGEFRSNPDTVIRGLHQRFLAYQEREVLEMLADICHYLGRKTSDDAKAIRYYTSCALYSYHYLFGENLYPARGTFSSSGELFCIRYYNASVTHIFEFLSDRGMLWLESFMLPTVIDDSPVHFEVPLYDLSFPRDYYDKFTAASNYRVSGALTYSGRFGIGVPMVGELKSGPDVKNDFLSDGMPTPLTIFLRFKFQDKRVSATFEFYDTFKTETVQVNGKDIPLELDFTTPLAFMLKTPEVLPGIFAMLNPDKTSRYNGIYMLTPYSKDRIPVVFVHGLMSNPRTWAQLLNTLLSTEAIRQNYQFMMFGYSTGNPIIYSAKQLRTELTGFHQKFNPGSDNPNFNRMVVIGHSMGGLLTKTLIQDSGDYLAEQLLDDKKRKIWDNLTEEQRAYFQSMAYFKALPFVRRVVFMAVPHQGSDLATKSFAGFFASLISLPKDLINEIHAISKSALIDAGLVKEDGRVLIVTGIGNLNPKDPSLKALNALPFKDDVIFHSVIGNRKKADTPGGDDGVVSYLSSHLDGAKSELVVKSGHSVQSTAAAIDEIRRILLLHLYENGLLQGYGFQRKDLKEKSGRN
jgi:pimeloyl-ACP methyl ester carboxylesterase